MHSKRRLVAVGAAVAIAAVTTGAAALTANAQAPDPVQSAVPVVWNLPGTGADHRADLVAAGFDIAHHGPDGTFVIGDDAVAAELRELGYDPRFHDTVYKDVAPGHQRDGTYYGGYRTAAAHEAHLHDVAAEHPDLAVVHDIGDSWRKTQGDERGHDIWAVCLTKVAAGDCERSPDSHKPRLSVIAQIHAREIATGEVASRWVDSLVAGYGTDDAVTDLLDTTEVWVVPIANPDGVDIVASGGDSPVLHRKNANDTDGSCGSSLGVDLNRNSTFEWGADSTDPCGETYQGAAAGSEPETAAIEDWLRDLHPDQRGDGADEPAPDDARDVFISLHSYGEYIIVPWGYTEDRSPNDAQLRALGESMSESNGYLVGTNGDTVGYATSGTTDDMAYGELGVAAFTFEMGGGVGDCGGFLPAFDCVEQELWPVNEGALLTAAQAATAPYAG